MKAENEREKEACEERLLQIAGRMLTKEASLLFLQEQDWPVIRHFHPQRENAAAWLPVKDSEEVLEIGAGCGAVTRCLCRMAGHVTAMESSETLTQALSIRLKDRGNLTALSGNWRERIWEANRKYDWIVFSEEQELCHETHEARKSLANDLALLRQFTAPGGKLVLGVYNPYGLMFFAGCAEAETGRLFEGIEGCPTQEEPSVLSRRTWEEKLRLAGFDRIFTYYPFPTHLMPNRVFSDDFLPAAGELKNDTYSFRHSRVRLFDEQKAWDQILKDGLFPQFSNSYFLIAEASWNS